MILKLNPFKRITFLILMACCALFATLSAQTDTSLHVKCITYSSEPPHMPVIYPDSYKQPEFPGGLPEFVRYLHKNTQVDCFDEQQPGCSTIHFAFTIDTMGFTQDVIVLHSQNPNSEIENAFKKRIEQSPKWIPGSKNNKKISARQELLVRIRLE